MDLRGASLAGNIVGSAPGATFISYVSAPSSGREEARGGLDEVQEECRRCSRWMSAVDALEVMLENEAVRERLQELLLSALSVEEREDVGRARHDDRMTCLLVMLRRREDLETEVLAGLRRVGVSLSEQDIKLPQKPVSAVLYETRLRLALTHLRQLEGLPDATLSDLRDVGCLSRPEHRQVKDGERTLTSVLLDHHADQLHGLRAVLRRRHADIYLELCDAFLRAQLSSVGHFHHNVPTPPQPCVQRAAHEDAVRRWVRARARSALSPSVLLLHGIGGGGKSCLASKAACEALMCGFHRVLWLDAVCDRDIMLRVAAQHLSVPRSLYLGHLETLRGEVRSRMEVLKKDGERILLIVDDATNEDDLALRPYFDAVLVTSRVKTVGRCCQDAVSREIEGLSTAESEDLLTRLLTRDTRVALQAIPDMWKQLLDLLCTGGFHMPLTVKILGRLVQREQDRWETAAAQYLRDMKQRLMALRTKLKTKPIRPHSGEFFEHENVYAAIYLSVERLPAPERDRFERLSLFGRGEAISPITMATVWSEEESVAEDQLEYFETCSLLCHGVLASRRKLFILHDLIHDLLLGFISDEQRLQFSRDVVAAYSARLSSVDPADVFFSLRFVGLCLATGQAEVGARCLCRLSYNMRRIETRTADGLLLDFAATCACLGSDETLASFHRLMRVCLPIAIERDDADVVLRAAVARHHERPFREAEETIRRERRRDQLFVKLHCPREGDLGVPTGLCDAVRGETECRSHMFSLRWDESFRDFVVVVRKKYHELEVHSLLHRRRLMQCRSDSVLLRGSSGGRSVVCFDDNRVSEWRISDRGAAAEVSDTVEIPDGMRVLAVCHSIGNDDGYVLCHRDDDESLHVLRKDSGRLSRVCSVHARDLHWRKMPDRIFFPSMSNLWVCDECRVSIIYIVETLQIWNLEGILLKKFKKVDGFRVSGDGRRLALWTKSSSVPLISTSPSSSWFLDTSVARSSQTMPSKEEEKKVKEMKETKEAMVFPAPVHLDWHDDKDSLGNLVVLDLCTLQVVFSAGVDGLASVCFSPDGDLAVLTHDSVFVASTTEGDGRMAVTRSRRWSGGRGSLPRSQDRFGLCRRRSVGQLLCCSAASLLVQTADAVLRIDLDSGDECLVWDRRFVEEESLSRWQLWTVDPRNSAIAFAAKELYFSFQSRVALLKKIEMEDESSRL